MLNASRIKATTRTFVAKYKIICSYKLAFDMAPKVKNHFYSIARGRTTGIFTDWSSCEISVHKYHNAVYKGFTTLEEAIHFMLAGQEYSSCQEIPVHDFDRVKNVSSLGHRCNGNCTSILTNSQSDSESKEDNRVQIISQTNEGLDEEESVTDQGSDNETDANTELKTIVQSENPSGNYSYCHEVSFECFDVILRIYSYKVVLKFLTQ